MRVTVFGQQLADVTYLQRTCVYGVAIDTADRILVTRFKGRLVLPGGSLDPGESESEALVRESLEETGYQIAIGALLGRARQLVTRVETGKYRDKLSAFYRIEATEKLGPPTDPRHVATWMSVADAVAELAYESHRWAVELAC